ncbi:late embryogenesis abundant protein At5g17165-like [Nicotiana tabacum]|uniref:Late embryogenesis abundant protein At5g17165-like n=2 Tax=Nicotiana TaxID=4085 RepID=A0A1S3YTG0_TOBAC|nr:PREDICTED: uncharacterized protein LOC104221077 [Nicotiana sylvestris]XP_016455448.1 PREDICTED: uncharacterized protein LOC107779512 [Nicotiana tabacum]
MATTLQKRGFLSLGKRFLNQFSYASARNSPTLSGRRAVHASVYDKNPEEYVRPYFVVPDEVINDKYWAPHPQTGVFGPVTDHSGFKIMPASASVDSVLEQKAFFRPLEDLDKPAYV